MKVGVLTLTLLAGLALTCVLAGATYSAETSIPSDLRGRHMQVKGVTLRVLQEGSGRDVLLIHGSPGLLEDFDPIVDALRGSFRFTRFDRPGQGYSADAGRYDPAFNAEIAAALIEQLRLTKVIVAGHSYGGSTSLALALRQPPQVSAYIVIDSASYQRIRPLAPLFKALALPVVGTGLARLAPASTAQQRTEAGLTAEFAPRPVPAGFTALRARTWSQPKVMHALAVESADYDRSLAAQSPRYPEIKAPLYVLAQRDQLTRKATAERLTREVPGAQLTLVERTGHYVQIERPDVVIETLQRAAAEH
ncbi:MAG TPA: alpha/beta hydrolase [Polyangiales bacterium]